MSIRDEFEPLTPLDLKRCRTVSDIVEGMRHCSFGARMLGEVAHTFTEWIRENRKPSIIYDGKRSMPLYVLLRDMVARGWCWEVVSSRLYVLRGAEHRRNAPVLVIGFASEECVELLGSSRIPALWINQFGIAPPGLVCDGHFPNVVFEDPQLIVPVLDTVLRERIAGELMTASTFLDTLPRYHGIAPEVARGAGVLRTIVEDPDCTVFMTVSGAMTIAQMTLLVCDMLDRGMVQGFAATGALMAHGLIQGVGLKHWKYHPKWGDQLLADEALNRVTDTLEPEENFTHISEVIDQVLDQLEGTEPMSPVRFHRMIGEYLSRHHPDEPAILKSAFLQGVPVFVPAFVDSEIGNDVCVHNMARSRAGRCRIVMDLELDSRHLVEMAVVAKRMGIFTIGGGVPRNNIQNVAPLIEIMNGRLNLGLPLRKFSNGCRIAPDKMWHGHLSGCTYSEGGSWRKMDLSGQFAEIVGDATIAWPFIVKAVMEELDLAAPAS